jgi:hypothetical protein
VSFSAITVSVAHNECLVSYANIYILHTGIYRSRMRNYQHTASVIIHRYDILYGRHEATPASVQGVGVDF